VKIKDVLAKIAKGEELSEAEKTFIESYEEPDLDAAANARSKKERLKHEAKREELDAKILELEAEAEEAKAGGSELEKMQAMVDKLTAKNEQATQLLDAEKSARAESTRSNALGKVAIPWMDGVNDSYRQTVLTSAFEGIDTDDLSDATVTSAIVEKIVADNASFINSGKSGGAGTGGEKGGAADAGKFTAENVGQLSGQELLDNLEAAYAATVEV
jgi:hypothetical protein